MIIACIYAGPFLMKPNVFLKYDSVHSKCTPVIREDAGLINCFMDEKTHNVLSWWENIAVH